MSIFKLKAKRRFAEQEEKLGRIKFWNKETISKNYGARLSSLFAELARIVERYPAAEFLVVCLEKDKRKSWYSEIRGRVAVNVSFDPSGPEFGAELEKAVADYLLIEPGITKKE